MSNDCVSSCTPVVSIRKQIKQTQQKIVGSSFVENPRRKAVTQQYVAECLALEKNGYVVCHPAKDVFKNVLHDSIINLVRMICNKYASSNQIDVDDLIQDCFLRIGKRIGTFNSKRGGFTTWCTWVCSSMMNSRYRNRARYNNRFVADENIENHGKSNDVPILTNDIAETIRVIAKKFPKKRRILYGMFGNPDKSNFCLPAKIRLSKVAREIDVKYSVVYTFYKKVQMMFKERFAEGELQYE